MTFYLLLPLLLTLGVAFATQRSIGARSTRSLGRVAVIAGAAQVLLALLTVALVVLSLEQPREQRCPLGEFEGGAAIALLFVTAIIGGVLLATVIADARRHQGVLVWILLATPAAVVLPYVVFSALFYWGLACTS